MRKPLLHVRIAFHPRSDAALELARFIFKRMTGSTRETGIRIPVSFAPQLEGDLPPSSIDFGAATHTVLVFLVDARMSRRAGGGTGVEWGEFVSNQTLTLPPASPHCVLPVALDERAFDLSDRLEQTSFVRLDVIDEPLREDELFIEIAVRALQLLEGKPPGAATSVSAPMSLFLSHAKTDLPGNPDQLSEGERSGPVYELLSFLARGPVDSWYDAKNIPPGGRFDDEIRKGLLDCSTFIGVVTDDYSTREWCRREALEAKEVGRPIVMVDALEQRESRRFPYLGNAPTIRWHETPGMARRVVTLAIGEALRYTHMLQTLKTQAGDGDEVIPCPPELLTISSKQGARRIIYPDPPLGSEERELLGRVAQGAELTTPWSSIAGRLEARGELFVGMSLSAATDARRYGASTDHLGVVADDLSIMLLLAGSRLAYGGRLGHESPEEEDYTKRLFEHVRSFHPHAKEIFGRRLHPVVNYVGWPIHLGFSDNDYDAFGREAELVEVEAPNPLGVELELLGPDATGFFPPSSDEADQLAARRFAWGRGMTAMRERMRSDIDARVSVGGNLERFVGQLPGVLEECLLALEAQKPLYLVGAMGGATRLAVDGLEGRERPEFSLEWAREIIPAYEDVVELYRRNGLDFPGPTDARDRLRNFGREGPAYALRNGLSDAENRELFGVTDTSRMVELILTGLANLKLGVD